jgi:hypothetical protein
MESKQMISTEEAYSVINKETDDLSWVLCPVTYSLYIKADSLVCKYKIKSEGPKDFLELAGRVRFHNMTTALQWAYCDFIYFGDANNLVIADFAKERFLCNSVRDGRYPSKYQILQGTS